LGAPQFLFHLIALIKLLLRLRSQVRIGVRAVYPEGLSGLENKTNEQKRKRKRSRKKPSTSINKPYELTNPPTTLARHT
jgi:hypothetical protein